MLCSCHLLLTSIRFASSVIEFYDEWLILMKIGCIINNLYTYEATHISGFNLNLPNTLNGFENKKKIHSMTLL